MSSAWPGPDDEWLSPQSGNTRNPLPGDPDPDVVLGEEIDDALVDRVAERFIASVEVRGRHVSVMVQNGVVILEGTVDSAESKHAAGRLAWATPGVFDVCNMLVPAGEQ